MVGVVGWVGGGALGHGTDEFVLAFQVQNISGGGLPLGAPRWNTPSATKSEHAG